MRATTRAAAPARAAPAPPRGLAPPRKAAGPPRRRGLTTTAAAAGGGAASVGPQPRPDWRAGLPLFVFSAKPYVEKYFISRLRAEGFGNVRHTAARLDPETARVASGCEAVAIFVNDNANAEAIKALADGGVRFIALRCAGYDRVDLEAAREAGIKVARVPTYSPTSVAEHAVALLFAIERHVYSATSRVLAGNYALSGLVGRQLGGRTVGVLGTGAIGAEAARMFKGLGMTVLAYDLAPNPKVVAMGIPYLPLEQLLPACDVVSLHVPLLPTTYHFMNASRLAAMRKGATLINVSRGGLIDSDALLEALRSGHLGGVGLDVYEGEGSLFFEDWTSLQPGDRMKFWDRRFKELVSFPQVLVTPHTAFLTSEALDAIATTTISNLQEYALGKPLTNEVKPLAPPAPPAPAAAAASAAPRPPAIGSDLPAGC